MIKGEMVWAGKPSEIFIKKERHDKIFTNNLLNYPYDIIYTYNLYKCAKSAVNSFLYNSEKYYETFNKPRFRVQLQRLAMLGYYQKIEPEIKDFERLLKIASPTIKNNMIESVIKKAAPKIFRKYKDETKVKKDLSPEELSALFKTVAISLKINFNNGELPFTKNAIDFDSYFEND